MGMGMENVICSSKRHLSIEARGVNDRFMGTWEGTNILHSIPGVCWLFINYKHCVLTHFML